MSQHLLRFAAQQHPFDPFSSMRGHRDQVAALLLRSLNDGGVREIAGGIKRVAGDACFVGGGFNVCQIPIRTIDAFADKLFPRVDQYLGLVRVDRVFGNDAQAGHRGADFLGERNAIPDHAF